jgi:hypothetical protein
MKQFSFEISIKFQSFRIIFLFVYLGQLGSFSSLFLLFSILEFTFQSSIISFCCYHLLSKQSFFCPMSVRIKA